MIVQLQYLDASSTRQLDSIAQAIRRALGDGVVSAEDVPDSALALCETQRDRRETLLAGLSRLERSGSLLRAEALDGAQLADQLQSLLDALEYAVCFLPGLCSAFIHAANRQLGPDSNTPADPLLDYAQRGLLLAGMLRRWRDDMRRIRPERDLRQQLMLLELGQHHEQLRLLLDGLSDLVDQAEIPVDGIYTRVPDTDRPERDELPDILRQLRNDLEVVVKAMTTLDPSGIDGVVAERLSTHADVLRAYLDAKTHETLARPLDQVDAALTAVQGALAWRRVRDDLQSWIGTLVSVVRS